jgi:uncharacterized membrane protein YdjX (TVP38/TMEM64 family)
MEPSAKPELSSAATAKIVPEDGPWSGSRSRRTKTFGAAALVLLVIATVAAGGYFEPEEATWIRYVEVEIQSWGPLGALVSIGLMVLHSFVPFPAEFIAIANGMLFGAFWGVVITWTGAMLGAFAAFGLARLLGRPLVAKVVQKNDWQRIDQWTSDQGWQVLLISRFIPVIAFNLVNYAAGLTQITWFTFAWTTGIGILPATILMGLVGHNIEIMTWEAWIVLAAGGVVIWLLIRVLVAKHVRL